ncbi:MAG: alpha/beta hydrolase [Cyanobacteria bacterium J06639_14]
MKKNTVTINGLSVTAIGESTPTAIFIHGGPGVFGYSESFCKSISMFATVLHYHQRGSKETNRDIGIEDHIEDLESIIENQFPTAKPIVVGHSWGAMLALLFAAKHSRRIQKLILIGSGPLNSSNGKEFMIEILNRFSDRRDYFDDLWRRIETQKDETIQQSLANRYINQIVPFYQNEKVTTALFPQLYWDFRASVKTMTESDQYVECNTYEDALPQIQCPITVMHGSNDPLSPRFLFPIFEKHCPFARLHEFEKAGHYPWIGVSNSEFMEILKEEFKS